MQTSTRRRRQSQSRVRTFLSAAGFVALAGLILGGCGLIGEIVDREANAVRPGHPAVTVSNEDAQFHETLFVADLHADTMMWQRDILVANQQYGHVGLERLEQGNVSLQAFMAVTDTPFPRANGCVHGDDFNWTGLLQVAQFRPVETWFSLKKRALYQADRLQEFAARTQRIHDDLERPPTPTFRPREVVVIERVKDLDQVFQRFKEGNSVLGAIIGLEGAHALEGDIRAVDDLFEAGFRMIAPTHRFNNELGGASEGCGPQQGLPPYGRLVLEKATKLGMTVDLAHASSKTLQDVARHAVEEGYPVLISHTGVDELCPKERDTDETVRRNITDQDIRAIARTGGVIGVGFWPEAVCWEDKETYTQEERVGAIVDTMNHIQKVLSKAQFAKEMRRKWPGYDPMDHIAFGSDFDGAVKLQFDASGMSLLTVAMRGYERDGARVFSDTDIRKVAGYNVCRVLATTLPEGSTGKAEEICGPMISMAR